MSKLIKKEIDLTSFFSDLEEKSIYHPENVILLATSGGVDSVVLLQACLDSNVYPILVHCNFGLRGSEADKDEEFVNELASKNGLKLISKKILLAIQGNIQLQARNLRYLWFDELLKKYDSQCMLLGHHLNDQTETILMHLIRGTGLQGLHLPARRGKYFRPLLSYTKSEILDYAKKRNLIWREDASNKNETYKRNILRHQILGKLEEITPSIHQIMGRNAERFVQTQNFVNKSMHIITTRFIHPVDGGLQIKVDKISNYLGYALDAFLIYALLKKYKFSYKQCVALSKKTTKKGAFCYNSVLSHRLYLGSMDWYLMKQEKIEPIIVDAYVEKINFLNYQFVFEKLHKCPKFEKKQEKRIAYLAMDKVNWPLKIRVWENGDVFAPLGHQGTQKVSDFLTNMKMPRALKERQLVLEDSKNIIWIVGKRISEKVKVALDQKEILKIIWINMD